MWNSFVLASVLDINQCTSKILMAFNASSIPHVLPYNWNSSTKKKKWMPDISRAVVLALQAIETEINLKLALIETNYDDIDQSMIFYFQSFFILATNFNSFISRSLCDFLSFFFFRCKFISICTETQITTHIKKAILSKIAWREERKKEKNALKWRWYTKSFSCFKSK